MHNASSRFKFLCYADDTTLLASLNNFDHNNLSADINRELVKVNDWLKVNKLSLNVGKTKYMLFSKPYKILPNLDIQISNSTLELVTNFTFLGLTIDHNLTWKSHMNNISNKISKICGIIAKLKNILPSQILLHIYNALILPNINYCILIWGFMNTSRIS